MIYLTAFLTGIAIGAVPVLPVLIKEWELLTAKEIFLSFAWLLFAGLSVLGFIILVSLTS